MSGGRVNKLGGAKSEGFTLIELLVVIAIIAILTAILFPVFAAAKASAKKAVCTSNMRQAGLAFEMYMDDSDERMPDRRDLKTSLPGGYRPWTSWPPSDPRAGWAAVVFQPYIRSKGIWLCPASSGSQLGTVVQTLQAVSTASGADTTTYWMWRFDRPDYPVLLEDFWGKTEDQAVADLITANDPLVGQPEGVSDVEMIVDPYFPKTVPSVPPELKGKAVHFGGRNRLFLDWHVRFLKDARTP